MKYRTTFEIQTSIVTVVQSFWLAVTLGFAILLCATTQLKGQDAEFSFSRALLNDAEKGDPKAQFVLAGLYHDGDFGVPLDRSKAAEWYRKAAEQGNADAQGDLGNMLLKGDGVPKDVNQGIGLLRKAAGQGDVRWQRNLGVAFDLGIDVRNASEAAKWYLRAAKQGDGDCQFYIGKMYAQGDGVMQNFIEAYTWFNIAASSTNVAPSSVESGSAILKPEMPAWEAKQLSSTSADEARDARTQLAQQMTPEQIAEAQRHSAEFIPRKEAPSSSSDDSPSPESPIASGTGFFITDDGYLITNNHVVENANQVRLVTSAGTISAKVVMVDSANDLALLKADGNFLPLPLASSRTAKLGSTVATVGFPDPGLQGFSPKLAKGEIASLSGAADDPHYFQISVPVQPGNSGGALVDERGNVIGIVSAKLDASTALAASGALPENVNYAVKSSFLLSFLESVPEVSAKLKDPNTKDEKFEDVVKSSQDAAVLVLVY